MRISTGQTWASALNNLMTAQTSENDANTQVSTQKISTNLEGYGRSSEIIAAYQSTLANTNSYISVSQTVSDRLSSQDLALTTTSQSASDAKDSIMNALASGDGTSLMQSISGNFATALDGLNYQYDGQYLFGGGNDNSPPVTVNSLSQLASASSGSAVFDNGTVKKTSKIDPNTTIQTGMLASDLGAKLMQTFQDIQQYNDDPSTGPFGQPLTDAQTAFLTAKSQEFNTEYSALTEQTAVNGTMQDRVTNTTTALNNQATSLQGLIGTRTDADMATAYSNLTQAQVAVQASSQVLSSLSTDSLLNILK